MSMTRGVTPQKKRWGNCHVVFPHMQPYIVAHNTHPKKFIGLGINSLPLPVLFMCLCSHRVFFEMGLTFSKIRLLKWKTEHEIFSMGFGLLIKKALAATTKQGQRRDVSMAAPS